ncbi:beta strand repeat-containing protein [Vibrio sp. RC27]
MSLQLKVVSNGQVSFLRLSEIHMVYYAQPGAIYTLVDSNGNSVVEDIELRHYRDKLEIIHDERPVAILEDFYTAMDQPAVYSFNGDFESSNGSQELDGTLVAGGDVGSEPGVVWNSEIDSLDLDSGVEELIELETTTVFLTEPELGDTVTNEALEEVTQDSYTGLEGLTDTGVTTTDSDIVSISTDEPTDGFIIESGNSDSGGNNLLYTTLGVLGAAGVAGLAGGSDSGSGGGGSSAVTSVSVSAFAGEFISTVGVTVYDEFGNVLTSQNVDMSNGSVSLTLGSSYSGPVLVVISDINGTGADYIDETSGVGTSLTTTLSAMTTVSGNSVEVSVTPLTELAVQKAGIDLNNISVSSEDVAVNEAIGSLFGVTDITGNVVTVLDDDYIDGNTDAELYGEVLAMLSGADTNTGSLSQTINQLSNEITISSSGAASITQAGTGILEKGADTFEKSDDSGIDLGGLIDTVDPLITSGSNAKTLAENSGAGQVVYIVAATDDSTLTYSLSGADANAFSLNSSTGTVTLIADPDFEFQPRYTFTITATDSYGNDTSKTVNLAITDVDEDAPSINSPSSVTVDENSGSNQVVYELKATDQGSGKLTYSFSNVDSDLSVDSSTGKVTLKTNPNAEAKPNYQFTVTVTDVEGNFSSDVVTIAVNDLDESDPEITSGTVAAAINENSGNGQVVYTVTAADTADIDDSASTSSSLTYSLSGADKSFFSINSSTGHVTLKASPDYETKQSYSFTVTATDKAGNSDTENVTLNIKDVDDTNPAFTSSSSVSVNENVDAGTLVYTAVATDQNSVTYSLTGSDANSFNINSSTGKVTLKASPDYEAKSSYSFTVRATDANGNSSDKPVTLSINNLDDTAPVFTSSNVASIEEGSGSNQVVYTAIATDDSSVTYSLSGADKDSFTINSSNGKVSIKNNPNFDSQSSYNFTVVATDSAGNETNQNVTLSVIDIDTSAPVFSSGNIANAIDENSGSGQVVYTAAAADDSSVTYSISGADAGSFSINSTTGAVTLNADPDFESKPSYSFTVTATDSSLNSSIQNVTLAVNDLADTDITAPTFTSSPTASVDENVSAGTLVYTAVATDASAFTYSLTGADSSAFNLNSSTGAVTLKASPDYETKTSYSFTVTATDTFGNASAQNVTLAVNDLADTDITAPTFTSSPTASVDENVSAGTLVYTAVATDASAVTYSLTGADFSAFNLNSSTGAVTLKASPDYETKTSYSFTITATDTFGNASAQNVSLAVNDVADTDVSAPVFSSNAVANAIDENSGSGQVVYTAAAVDDSSVTYGISGADAGLFSVNESTGAVTLNVDPDFESKPSYSFTVTATDSSSNSSTQDVTLAVNDLNENSTATVVFDLATGDSTGNGGSFDANTTYSIYVVAGDYDGTAVEQWTQPNNLGNDDSITFVSGTETWDGDISNRINSGTVGWTSQVSNIHQVDLWDGSIANITNGSQLPVAINYTNILPTSAALPT